jgi:hypothetical protein
LPFVVGRRIVVSQEAVLEAAMVSWWEELDRREAAAREEIAELRDNVEGLSRPLADRQEMSSGWRRQLLCSSRSLRGRPGE